MKRLKSRYLKACKEDKSTMLDECCRMTGINRKHAIVQLSAKTDLAHKAVRQRKARQCKYDKRFVVALKKVWEVLDYPCGARLKPVLLETADKLAVFGELNLSDEIREKLKAVSAWTIDQKLKRSREQVRKRIQGTTKPGSLLKSQIPIRTSSWEETCPGFCEMDLVANCGMSASGEFANTLNVTDILTGWTEQETFLGKAEKRVRSGLERIRRRLPFELRGIDSDNGSEFINWQLYRWCESETIAFTRGRPYRKNDNAHVEQKNWTHVRQVYGYERIEREEVVRLMSDLNRNELRLYKNFFQPTMKLVEKRRVGKHGEGIRKVYDEPKTPYRRTLMCDKISEEEKMKLRKTYEKLNPAELRRTIMKKLKIIHKKNAALMKKSKPVG